MKADIKRLRCRGKGRVEIFSCYLAVFDCDTTRFTLAVAGLGVGFIADGARLLVLEVMQALFRDWSFTRKRRNAIGCPFDGHGTQAHVAVFNLRVDGVPELLLQIEHELEARLNDR